MAIDNVKFSQGTTVGFKSVIKDSTTIYFLTDSKEIYLGGDKFAFGQDTTINVTGLGDCVISASFDKITKTLNIVLGDAGSLPSVVTAITDAIAEGATKVSAAPNGAIAVDTTDPKNATVGLKLNSTGNVTLTQSADGLKADVDFPEAQDTIAGLASGEKILSINNKELSSTLTISSEKVGETTYVVLKGVKGVEVSKFDASDFVKAGMLKTVSLVDKLIEGSNHKVLSMVFTVEGNQEQTIEVDLQTLVDLYEATPDGGITLIDNEMSLTNKILPSTGNLQDDVTTTFGQTVVLKTFSYNANGMITGVGDFNFTLPTISASQVGTASTKTTLLTYVKLNTDGTLSGETVDILTSLGSAPTDTQILSAKAVKSAIDANAVLWERF